MNSRLNTKCLRNFNFFVLFPFNKQQPNNSKRAIDIFFIGAIFALADKKLTFTPIEVCVLR